MAIAFILGEWMNDVLGHHSALEGYATLGIIWAYEMNYGMTHSPGAGSLARPVGLHIHTVR